MPNGRLTLLDAWTYFIFARNHLIEKSQGTGKLLLCAWPALKTSAFDIVRLECEKHWSLVEKLDRVCFSQEFTLT